MAHELSTASGKVEMFYVGGRPWHGLGTELADAPTSADAIRLAGLDWRADLEVMETLSGAAVPNSRAVVRSDTREVLGVVGRRYSPVQNAEAFDFLDSLVGTRELAYETAGALGRGERVWMLARLPGDLVVKGTSDGLTKYLLLSNSHDGSGSVRVFFTAVRVVCNNTLCDAHSLARRRGVSIRHTGDVADKIYAARRILGLASRHYESLGRKIDRMASSKIRRPQLWKYFEGLFPDPIGGDGSELARLEAAEVSAAGSLSPAERRSLAAHRAHATRRANGSRATAAEVRAKLTELFEAGAGNAEPGVRGTWWAAYNAVTEYVDHVARGKDGVLTGDQREARLNSIWFGSGAAIKGQAWESALAAVGPA